MMLTYHQKILLKHGFIILLVGLFGGFFLTFSVLGMIPLFPLQHSIDFQIPGTPAQWRAVHVGNIMNGLMAIIFSLVMAHLQLTVKSRRFVTYGTVATIWGNALFYIFGIFTPNKGLTLGDNSVGEANWASVIAFTPAFVVAFVLIFIVIVLYRGIPKD